MKALVCFFEFLIFASCSAPASCVSFERRSIAFAAHAAPMPLRIAKPKRHNRLAPFACPRLQDRLKAAPYRPISQAFMALHMESQGRFCLCLRSKTVTCRLFFCCCYVAVILPIVKFLNLIPFY